ncbi:carbohydrate kinase [Tilletiaria anomala UBC 951]|uniref:gluconokinase n=1 Tax=Tilletiaria anomala (strain ATCC 24038 / CBS 436.72 / UBC 951) TaxID=1037660 RepID=A0A066V9C2_TILAU|nr:carbohydrate kinase [Tilletiaria anomala UBC 951]KDN38096.1 carbohydrate kinase [Tilletiaria anomala UBC 951]
MATPVLLVMMGTSGCGKTTISSILASKLGIPFIDGDDLHPRANVQKMSEGHPLDDRDREPWLKTIRERAIELTSSSKPDLSNVHNDPTQTAQHMAEVLETSQPTRQREAGTAEPDVEDQGESGPVKPVVATEPRRACIIACSALKRAYRNLLRGETDSLFHNDSEDSRAPNAKSDIDTHHIYLHVAPDELLRRMHNRKGHFMKEQMLRSQLETLEEPDPHSEYGVIVVEAARAPGLVVASLVQQINEMVGPVCGPPA